MRQRVLCIGSSINWVGQRHQPLYLKILKSMASGRTAQLLPINMEDGSPKDWLLGLIRVVTSNI